MTTLERVKIAFRKLKASVYFDKTTLPLRDAVVAFEARGDFEIKLAEIADAYDNATLDGGSALISEILSSISAMSFPKKMCKAKNNDGIVISVGNPKDKPIVEELQYFIDMSVCGHILGVLWVMAFGKKIDNDCYQNAFGNRLRTKLIWNDDSDEIKNSPALFEPYFAQYSLWRDGGLSCAEDLLAKKHDVLILTLDLKKYYYNTGITDEAFNSSDLLRDAEKKDIVLHKAIFSIIKKYTEVLQAAGIKHNGNVLPIGFLPSPVLSNWCLAKFDKGILDFWNPAYYGRYVDDIIIVEKIEKGSEIYNKAREGALVKNDVIDYYLGDGRRKSAPFFVEREIKSNAPNTLNTDSDLDSDKTDSIDILYRVNAEFCLSEGSVFEFQSEKTRIIALFAENNSTALISKFKQEILENVSEFRFMPEVGEAFSQDDFSQFYKLENDATINKLRGVKEISMDKYELSKFLGKYRVVSSLVDDGSIKEFTRIIGRMFNDRELIDNYTLWERVLEIFITDKNYDGFIKFVKRIKSAIKDLSVIEIEIIDGEKKGKDIDASATRDNLYLHLTATLNRTLSLLWGKDARKIKNAICDFELCVGLCGEYIETRMSNKYVMAVPNEILACPDEQADVNFTEFASGFQYLCDSADAEARYELLPYFRQAQDIAMARLLKSICSRCVSVSASPEGYVDEIRHGMTDIPIEVSNDVDGGVVYVNGKMPEKMKVAIANVNVARVSDLENVLKGRKLNRKYARYRALANLVNAAIKENADMLVLPESFVPFEWLPALATKAARDRLSIITGVEHIVVKHTDEQNHSRTDVYNYTAVILPFKYYKSIPTAAIFFQLKKHYAPEERRLIEGYRANPVSEQGKRPLYHWGDCYFPVYCCYELTSISDRAEFMSWADMVVAVEYNSDTNYFSNIVESLARDLHCYFVQVNTSQYGDSRITQPTRSEERNLVAVKGGLNQALLVGEIDVQALREFQIQEYTLQKSGAFKPTPPGINVDVIRDKIDRRQRVKGNDINNSPVLKHCKNRKE